MDRKVKKIALSLFLLCLFCGISFVVYPKGFADVENKVDVNWIIPPKYYQGSDFSEGRAWVQEKEGGPWTLFNDKGNILREGLEADYVAVYRDGIARFMSCDMSLTGFVNLSGDIIVPPCFESGTRDYYEGLMALKDKNGLYGFIGLNGNWVILPNYDNAMYFQDGLAPVMKGEKWGYIDKTGAVVIDYKFNFVTPFSHGIAVVGISLPPVMPEGKIKIFTVDAYAPFGLIDKTGKWIAEPIYEAYYSPWSDQIGMQKNDKVGFIDAKGNVVIDFRFAVLPYSKNLWLNAYCFNGGVATVILDETDRENREFGIINEAGDIIFTLRGRGIPFFEGDFVSAMRKDGALILWDRNGRRYSLPPYFRHPPVGVGAYTSNIFRTWDIEDHNKTGYFTIID
jgi:hypothetical protein